MLDFVNATILGVVEGATEFLPISSTGHLILVSKLLGTGQSEFLKSFEISIQLGAILSVLVLYWKKLFFEKEVFTRVAVAFLPTAVFGFIFYRLVKDYLIGNITVVLWTLLFGGIGLIIFDLIHKEKETAIGNISELSYKKSFLIGLCQSVSMLPGISRAAATIIGGLTVGMKREAVVEFSFLLAVPTMAAATAWDMLKSAGGFSSSQFGIIAIGFAVSVFSALGAVKFLLTFVKKHSFVSFGMYRIAIAAIFWLFII